MGRRIQWLGVGLLLCFGLVTLQLVNIQVRQAPALDASANNPRNQTGKYNNLRGNILAVNTEILASSVRIAHPGNSYKYYRTYPTGTLFSQIIGYSSVYFGTTGIEQQYNTDLVAHTQNPTDLQQFLNPPPPTTDSVTLTVEPYLQQVAKTALASIPSRNKDGAVVVLNPKTGSVLAMYSNPSYNDNTVASPNITTEQAAHFAAFGVKDHEGFYAGYPIATFHPLNPGSTFKVVTTAAVYNLKPSLANFVFPPASCLSLAPYSNKSICNDNSSAPTAACGGTIAEMLPPSCDPGYAKLGETLGATVLYKQASLFGYDQVPPIDLPHVAASQFPQIATFSLAKMGPPGLAYSAFGQQDVLATTLQQAMVASAIANDGTLMTPHLLSSIHAQDTTPVERYSPKVYKQSTTPAAAAQVNDLMQNVAKFGTAAGIFPAAWQVAAKTGTAQTGTTDTTTNTQDWMIAFAPASNPVVAVCVTVPYQPITSSGARIAGPIMKVMLTATLHPPAGQ